MENPAIEQRDRENDENGAYSDWFNENLPENAENYADYLVKFYGGYDWIYKADSFTEWCSKEWGRMEEL